MKILVCISKVPDTTSRIEFTNNNTEFNESGVQFIVNPYDEWYSLVRALELVEANSGIVTTITVGGSDTDPIIRKALAIGANDAVRIDVQPGDAGVVAAQIAEYAKNENYDLILCGKETIDYNSSQVGGMLAEMLNLPFVSLGQKLDLSGTTFTVECEIQGGREVVEVTGPCVISCAKGMAEQRIPNMRGIMSARSKPFKVIPPVAITAFTSITSFELPAAKGAVKLVDPENVEELVNLLHNEAKVI